MNDILEHEMEDVVNEVLCELPEQIQIVLRLRFFNKMTFKAIAGKIKVTRETARQKEASGLRKLRHPSRINKLQEWMDYCNERN